MSISFVQDKISFFQSIETLNDSKIGPNQIDKACAHFLNGNIEKKFKFLSDNRRSIEHEFNELQACLNANGEARDEFWLFCYYTSFMLKTYYETYNPEKASDYKKACDAIEGRFTKRLPEAIPEVSLLEMLSNDLQDVISTPFDVAKLRPLIGQLNIQRLSTRFALLSLKQWLMMANQWHLLDGLQAMLGRSINIDILDAPLGIYNALSVGLCGLRLVLDLGMLVKHTYFPEGQENELTPGERASVEFQRYYYHLGNDFVWTTVNTLCNYGYVAGPVANILLAGFTMFDIVWLGYLLKQVDADYALKRQELKDYQKTLARESAGCLMAAEQLKQLDLSAEKDRMELVFYLVAACIFETGLLAAFILAPPAFMPVCLLLCNTAMGMYLSGDKYGVYSEKCMISTQEPHNEKARVEMNDAWNDLTGTMLKKTIMPFIFLGAFTVSVPAAILLTLAYIAHERGMMAYLPHVADCFSPAPNMGRC